MKIYPKGIFGCGFQSLEIRPTFTSSLWKLGAVAIFAAMAARGQEAVSALELLRQSREQVAVTNLDFALSLAKAAVEVDPALVDAWKQQGRVEMLAGKTAAAFSSFSMVARLRPDDAEVAAWMPWLLLDAGYTRDVASRLEQRSDAELLKLGDPLVARTLGALLHRDFNEDATKLAARWQKISTNDASRAATAVFGQLARGENSAAVAALEKIGPDKSAKELLANAWLRVGRVRAKANDEAGSKAAFLKALEIIPGWVPAEKELNPPPPKK